MSTSAVVLAALRIAIATLPLIVVAVVRALVFGRAAPLAVLAKAADPVLGARYALACFLLTGPVAIVAPLAWRKLDWGARGLLLATLAHFLSIAVAGGDWMPLSRLAAPALPAVILAAAHVAAVADLRATAFRVALALAGEIFQFARVGPDAAHVGGARLAVIHELAPALASSRVVAALDVGWLGAATDVTIVDLAGLTDPAIAVLPGGHTSKRIPASLLDARGVDTLVLLVPDDAPAAEPWFEAPFARVVERRVATLVGEAFEPVAESHVPHLRYVVARRTEAPP